MLRGDLAAILILRRGVGDFAVGQARNLDAHLAAAVSTSTNSRARAILFSSLQRKPMVVVSRKSNSRIAGTRSGRQSTVIPMPVRPFFICTGTR